MEKEIRCKRCGRILRSKKSIELGYGRDCYKLKQLEESGDSELVDLRNKWNHLSLKYSIFEKKLQKLIDNGVSVLSEEPIERINQDDHRPERNGNQINMIFVVKELKIVFEEGVKLEKVPDSFRNHPDIYQLVEVSV